MEKEKNMGEKKRKTWVERFMSGRWMDGSRDECTEKKEHWWCDGWINSEKVYVWWKRKNSGAKIDGWTERRKEGQKDESRGERERTVVCWQEY